MIKVENLILGAGIAGIAASYELKSNKIDSLILEKNGSWGGLLDNFEIDGFRFDKFIHLSFSKDQYVNDIFFKTQYIKHNPLSYNYYYGKWLKHPAQNNLYPLTEIEKKKIIKDFENRKKTSISEIKNYEDWLRAQYGDYFAENFPMRYTEKYWTIKPSELEIKWIGNRLYIPSIEEVKKGCINNDTPNTYYASEMRYPRKGGYKSFIKPMVNQDNIKLNSKVKSIDLKNKQVEINNNIFYKYENLISSLPLPEICKLIKDSPLTIKNASDQLNFTSGYIISLGFNKPDIADKLWFYIYNSEIKISRVYSPSLKSPDNVPKGCSSFQAELYFNKREQLNISKEELLEQTIFDLIKIGVFKKEDLIVKDIRLEKYANVIFDHNIYSNRNIILNYLEENSIISIGRFGEWEYFWSDQSLLSGRNGALKLMANLNE